MNFKVFSMVKVKEEIKSERPTAFIYLLHLDLVYSENVYL